MIRGMQLRLVRATFLAAAFAVSGPVTGQHDVAAGWSHDGQLPSNPFRQAALQGEVEESPSPANGIGTQLDSAFKPIGSVGVEIAPLPQESLPERKSLESLEGMATSTVLVRPWPTLSYHWVAPATRHNPLYFEEVNAERYGYTCSPCLQPAISTAHFFGTLPALPYLVGADCCRECQYTLGHYRPGSCNPWRPHYWPVSARGALCQAGVVTGVAFLP